MGVDEVGEGGVEVEPVVGVGGFGKESVILERVTGVYSEAICICQFNLITDRQPAD